MGSMETYVILSVLGWFYSNALLSVPAADHLVSPVPRQATPTMPPPREVAPPRMGLFGA